jgi:hypothetical protein
MGIDTPGCAEEEDITYEEEAQTNGRKRNE